MGDLGFFDAFELHTEVGILRQDKIRETCMLGLYVNFDTLLVQIQAVNLGFQS